jgi:hypothetical protein
LASSGEEAWIGKGTMELEGAAGMLAEEERNPISDIAG